MAGRFQLDRIDPIAVYAHELPDLRRRGPRLWGRCPFHSERTPSFSISLKNRLWYCFSCGVGGDAIALVMRLHRISFRDAAVRLGAWSDATSPAELARFRREAEHRRKAQVERERQRRIERQLMLDARENIFMCERLAREASAQLQAEPDREDPWARLALSYELGREAAVSFTILAFGSSDLRQNYINGNPGMLAKVLEVGYVVDDNGRIMELRV